MSELIRQDKIDQLSKKLRQQMAAFRNHVDGAAEIAHLMKSEQEWSPVFKDWRDFCQNGLGITERHGDRLVRHVETRKNIASVPDLRPIGLKLNEAQTREISDLSPESQVDVIAKHKETGRPFTAKGIKATKAELLYPNGKPVIPPPETPIEPPEQADPDQWKIERSRGIKTAEALQRVADELHHLKRNKNWHQRLIDIAQEAAQILKGWE